MSDNPETLRLYASIFEKGRRANKGGVLYEPSEIEKAAAKALRERADALEKPVHGAAPGFLESVLQTFARCESCGGELGHWPDCAKVKHG